MYQVYLNKLSVSDFIKVRNKVNFIDYEESDIEVAIKNSLLTVVIYENDQPIAMARVVGDGVIAFLIKDVAVIPEKQGCGLGRILMKNILVYISKVGVKNSYIALMSTPGKEEFYEKFGFIKRPTNIFGNGMVMYYDGKKKF